MWQSGENPVGVAEFCPTKMMEKQILDKIIAVYMQFLFTFYL